MKPSSRSVPLLHGKDKAVFIPITARPEDDCPQPPELSEADIFSVIVAPSWNNSSRESMNVASVNLVLCVYGLRLKVDRQDNLRASISTRLNRQGPSPVVPLIDISHNKYHAYEENTNGTLMLRNILIMTAWMRTTRSPWTKKAIKEARCRSDGPVNAMAFFCVVVLVALSGCDRQGLTRQLPPPSGASVHQAPSQGSPPAPQASMNVPPGTADVPKEPSTPLP